MLNKQICKRCINKHEGILSWDNNDDKRWDKGFVMCPCDIKKQLITDDIYDECYFKLEHIVSNNEFR